LQQRESPDASFDGDTTTTHYLIDFLRLHHLILSTYTTCFLEHAYKKPIMSSRMELIAWLNDLLQLSYTKVEQCGSGAAFCQIADTVFSE
jgi:hypothetical protein